MDSRMENGKGERGVFPFFSLHSPLCVVYEKTWYRPKGRDGDQRVACVVVLNRGGGGGKAKGKFLSSLTIPLPFSLPLLPISIHNTVYFVKEGTTPNAKSFKGGHPRAPITSPLLTAHLPEANRDQNQNSMTIKAPQKEEFHASIPFPFKCLLYRPVSQKVDE